MDVIGFILLAVFLVVAIDGLRWKILVERELKRRNLVRVPSQKSMWGNPAPGYRLIYTCTCERDGRTYDVTFLNRGWFRPRLSVSVEPSD